MKMAYHASAQCRLPESATTSVTHKLWCMRNQNWSIVLFTKYLKRTQGACVMYFFALAPSWRDFSAPCYLWKCVDLH